MTSLGHQGPALESGQWEPLSLQPTHPDPEQFRATPTLAPVENGLPEQARIDIRSRPNLDGFQGIRDKERLSFGSLLRLRFNQLLIDGSNKILDFCPR
jgi:hypothetical protein